MSSGDSSSSALLGMTALLAGVYLPRGASRYLYGHFSHVVAYAVMADLMARIYRHLQRLSHHFFSQQRTGELGARAVHDVERLDDFLAHGVPELVLAAVPTAMLAVLFTIHPPLALIVTLPLPAADLLPP
jgi:ABC-type multidrug transport system fused ATPase/permease subunit